MTDAGVPGLGDLFALFGSTNPLAGLGRTLEQLRRGVEGLLTAIENVNETMEQLNGVTRRLNGFLDEVEEPVRTLMPQITRTLKAADAVADQMGRFVEVVGSPTLARVPGDVARMVEMMDEMVRRLSPLTQVAESAGSLLGLRPLLRGVGGSGAATSPSPVAGTTESAPGRAPTAARPTSASRTSATAKGAATKGAATKGAATKGAATKSATRGRSAGAKKAAPTPRASGTR